MKIIQSYYKWESQGSFYIGKTEKWYLVFWGNPEEYHCARFESLKGARKYMLGMVWDHPNFRGLSFPKTSRRIRELLE
jgi:hypothetical protein